MRVILSKLILPSNFYYYFLAIVRNSDGSISAIRVCDEHYDSYSDSNQFPDDVAFCYEVKVDPNDPTVIMAVLNPTEEDFRKLFKKYR